MGRKNIILGLALAAAVTAGVMYVQLKPAAPPAPPPAPAPPPPPPQPTAPSEPPPLPLPELGQSDGFIREKIKTLSGDPRLVAWLRIDNLVRRLTAGVDMIANGKVPRDAFSMLAPRKSFPVARKGGRRVLDPKGYARYDFVGDVMASLDAKATVTLFKQTKPLFQSACLELGYGNCDFQQSFVKATKLLLQTPIVDGDIRLKDKDVGICYAMTDSRLESLSPAQKQLVRMGPRNTVKIQGKLSELAAGLGVPDADLPRPTHLDASVP